MLRANRPGWCSAFLLGSLLLTFGVAAQTIRPGYGAGGPASSSTVSAEANALAAKYAGMRPQLDRAHHLMLMPDGSRFDLGAKAAAMPGFQPKSKASPFAGDASATQPGFASANGKNPKRPPRGRTFPAISFTPNAYLSKGEPVTISTMLLRGVGPARVTWTAGLRGVVLNQQYAVQGDLAWAPGQSGVQSLRLTVPRLQKGHKPVEFDVHLSSPLGAEILGGDARIVVVPAG